MAELSPLDQDRRLNSPPLQEWRVNRAPHGSGQAGGLTDPQLGRGWGLTAGRLDNLNGYAREMRRQPTEPEIRLWGVLSRSKLGYKFRRQSVIGPFIADFLCPQKALIVEVDGDTHDVDTDLHRDAALRAKGYAVFHVTNEDVMRNLDGVREMILIALQQASDRWESPHPNPSPEGEGLEEVRAPL